MNEDYGKQMGAAIEAVALLQSDISRLFREMHSDEFRGYESVFGSYCTRDVPRDYKRSRWMPKAVYRYYRKPSSSVIDGVTVIFLSEKSKLEEPLLVAFQLKYRSTASGKPKKCKEWDAYNLYLNASDYVPNGEVVVQEFKPEDSPDQRLRWAKLAAVPVYSIEDRDHVRRLVEKVRRENVDELEP